jgi:hypothetical protein
MSSVALLRSPAAFEFQATILPLILQTSPKTVLSSLQSIHLRRGVARIVGVILVARLVEITQSLCSGAYGNCEHA